MLLVSQKNDVISYICTQMMTPCHFSCHLKCHPRNVLFFKFHIVSVIVKFVKQARSLSLFLVNGPLLIYFSCDKFPYKIRDVLSFCCCCCCLWHDTVNKHTLLIYHSKWGLFLKYDRMFSYFYYVFYENLIFLCHIYVFT